VTILFHGNSALFQLIFFVVFEANKNSDISYFKIAISEKVAYTATSLYQILTPLRYLFQDLLEFSKNETNFKKQWFFAQNSVAFYLVYIIF
jgi:hypothetical protein